MFNFKNPPLKTLFYNLDIKLNQLSHISLINTNNSVKT